MEELLTEGFGAVKAGDYEKAYDLLSTEIEGYTGREYISPSYRHPDYLINIVAREEEYSNLPEHLSALVHQGEDLYDLEKIRPRVHEVADEFAE